MSDDESQTESTANATFCATLVDEWIRAGLTDAVIAPGSRSTPMALAVTARSEIEVHVHHDERAAGFTALGLGLVSGRAALVLTTSGTAAVELHPAVVEAHQSGVPLLVITADRPPELHEVGAPQTVDQTHLFGRSVRWFAEPGPPSWEAASTWRSLGSRAFAETASGAAGAGPVHLNLAFREPLVGRPFDLPPGRDHGRPWHRTEGRRLAVGRPGTEVLSELLDVDRGLIVAGAGCGEPGAVLELANLTGWPVVADPRSGCRLHHPSVVVHADSIVRHEHAAATLRPDAVLHLGAIPASKELAGWLKNSGATHVAVDASGRWHDPDRLADHVLQADPSAVANALCRLVARQPVPGWGDRWRSTDEIAARAIDAVLDEQESIAEPHVARTLCREATVDDVLVVSSSMPIRDVEWYGGPTQARILANRGANGIDGVVSTAIGVALAARGTGSRTFALVGDVAFLHDASALVGLARRNVDLTIVVVDNDGGGIFSFLPQARELPEQQFEVLFGTPHGTDLATLAAAHGLVTITPSAPADLASTFRAARAGGVQVVRAFTDRAANVELHRRLNEAVASGLSGVFGA